jgi:hypothetical protein
MRNERSSWISWMATPRKSVSTVSNDVLTELVSNPSTKAAKVTSMVTTNRIRSFVSGLR